MARDGMTEYEGHSKTTVQAAALLLSECAGIEPRDMARLLAEAQPGSPFAPEFEVFLEWVTASVLPQEEVKDRTVRGRTVGAVSECADGAASASPGKR